MALWLTNLDWAASGPDKGPTVLCATIAIVPLVVATLAATPLLVSTLAAQPLLVATVASSVCEEVSV